MGVEGKRLLVLGAGRGQIGLYKAAKEMGITTIAGTMPDNNPPGIPLADEVCFMNIANPDEVAKKAANLKLDGVATCCLDTGISALGKTCDSLGLTGLPEKAAIMCNDKSKMKKAFMEYGVSTAQYFEISNEEELENALNKIKLPVIIKATDLQGSNGIYIAKTEKDSSYVVVDPKGGTLDQCGRFLQREKYRVRVFNSIDFSKSMHYNPLAYIKTESDVLKFVTALIANTKGDGKEGDEFWTKAETLLYCALVAYIVFEGPEEERNMNTLVEMINSMEVREDDETFKNAVDYMFDGLERRSPQHFAVRQYKKYKLASGKTAKSILISCGARLAPFDIPQLREIMSYDELELDKLGDEKSALFFLISDTDTTYNFLVALAFSQMFNLLCERADNTYGGRLPYHVRVLWDEAANTGQVPGLEKIVAVIRSREISLTLFYQAMSQCKALYKDHSETIMGNMDSIVFLGGREASTLKDISENWLGKATISMQTEGRSRGQSESYSQNMQRLGRELMTTSEITTMPGDKCILQLRGLPPFLSPKYDLKKHPNYKYTAEFDKKKNAFRLESLFRHRPLRLKPEDEYTVYEVDGSDTDEEADLLNFDDLDSDEFV